MTELVIGSRRPRRQRRLRGLGIAAGLGLLAVVVCYFIYSRVVRYPEPSAEMPSGAVAAGPLSDGASEWALFWGGECSLAHAGQLAVLRAVGKPHTLGACHGRLLAGSVIDATTPLSAVIRAAVPDDGILGGARRGSRLRWRLRLLDDGIPPARLEEIAGVVHGVERAGRGPLPYEMLVRAHAALDVGAPAGDGPGVAYGAVARSLSFVMTGLTAPAPDRGTAPSSPSPPRLLIGRSFSLFGAADGGDSAAATPVVSLVRPEGSIPYASVGWPGLTGVVTGVNAEGIAVLIHPATASDVRLTRPDPPVALLAREILEQAHTVDEAVRMVELTSPLGAAGFLIVDGRRRRLAWIERSPGRVRVVRDASPAVKGDFFTTEPFAGEAKSERARRMRRGGDRLARTALLVRRAPPGGVEQAVALLRDSAAQDGAPLPNGHRAAIDDPEAVHTVVIDPVELVLWVADGPGAGASFRAFDLRRELRGEQRAAPSDVPPDPQRDGGAADDVVAARRELRAARAARAAGEIARAREQTARALVLRPDLPESLLLAADLARADGDTEAARRLYRRYLEVGPDGPDDDAEVARRIETQP